MQPRLTIQVVGWDSAHVLPVTLASLKNVPADVVIRYIDNASTDHSVALVKQYLPRAEIVELPTNRGFAGGHNEGLRRVTTPFVLTLDPDVQLQTESLEKLLAAFSDEKVAAVQGKLYRSSLPLNKGEIKRGSNIIDSAGIVLTLALNGRERGANEADQGQYETPAPLIAVTGACGLYRMDALKKVAHSDNEFFDKDFFAYKEDVDLGWRLNNASYKVLYMPILAGYHARTLGKRGVGNWGLNPVTIYKRLKSPRTRYSLRNWMWMMIKNASLLQLILHIPFIAARKLMFLFLTILYPPLTIGWLQLLRGTSKMQAKKENTDLTTYS